MRILVVEDSRAIAEALVKGLREQGYAIVLVCEGETADVQAEINHHDAIVLDFLLPRLDGFSVCQALGRQGLNVPVPMLTARAAVEGRVAGLDAGADDYLSKPFAF
jgi:DNA-binding response OmpR family regulator